jgi:hypothetical protein
MIKKKLLSLPALIVMFSARVAMAERQLPEPQPPQTHSSDCLQDRVKCAYEKSLERLAEAYSKPAITTTEQNKQTDSLNEVISLVTPEYFVLALTGEHRDDALLNNLLSAWQRARVDKQIGASSTSKGTTDLVSRPSTSELLGLALQVGALTETVSGSVATFQANAEGAYRAIIGEPIICQDCLKPWSLNPQRAGQ